MDTSLISTISGVDEDTVIRYIRTLNAQAHGGRIGYEDGTDDPQGRRRAGKPLIDVDPLMSDLEDMGGVAGLGGATRVVAGATKLSEKSVSLTKAESKYIKELIDDTGGGKFTSDIVSEVPSLKIKNNKLIVKEKDLNSFNNFLDDLYIAERAPGGPGANTIPPRLRNNANSIIDMLYKNMKAQGGRIGAQGGGIMPLLDMGGMEKDYRQDGGFVPIGRKEKADDVPARLSKNEFVFTADAVKAAGGGDIDQGAQRMYNVMKNLEAGGEISEQSQGKA